MAPRGIVVLTVAQFFSSLFMDDKIPMAQYITPVTFGLVFITVVIYGFGFTPLSKLFGVASTEPPGASLSEKVNFRSILVLIYASWYTRHDVQLI